MTKNSRRSFLKLSTAALATPALSRLGRADTWPSQTIHADSIPEPTTWLAWSLVAGGAAWTVRRRRARV